METILFFLVVACLMLFIGYLAGRKQDEEGYNVYNRKLSKSGYLVSYAATYMGAGFFIAGTGYAYSYGMGLVWVLIGLVFGSIIFGFFAKWLREKTKDANLYTLPDYIKWRFGPLTAKIIAGITILILLSDMAVQLVGGGKLLETLGVMSYSTAVIITTLVVAIYLVFSGFRAVVWTDYVLLTAIVVLTGVIALFSAQYFQPTAEQLSLNTLPLGIIIGLFLFGVFEPFAISTYYQRIFASDSPATARKGTWLGSLAVFPAVIGILVIGIAAKKLFPDIDPDTAFLKTIQRGGKALSVVGALVLWAALLSTIDTVTFAASQILNRDILNKPLKRRNMGYAIVSLMSVGLLISFIFPSVIDASILFLGGGMVIAPILFFHWFMPKLDTVTIVSALITGMASLIVYVVFNGPNPTVVGIAFAATTFVLLATHFSRNFFKSVKI